MLYRNILLKITIYLISTFIIYVTYVIQQVNLYSKMDLERSSNRRMGNLKKFSVQLKQSTQDPQKTTNDLIYTIFKMGKQIIPYQKNQRKQYYSKSSQVIPYQQTNFKMQPDIISKIINKGSNKKQIKQINSYQNNPTIHELQQSNKTGRALQQSLSPTQQIDILKIQNNDIEEQIKILKQKLRKLEQLQKQQRQQQWRDGLPYFVINIPKLRIFYTKLTISQKDYDKIDYSLYSTDLNLQKITLNQLPQTGISSRPPKSICLMLSQLKQVSYPTKKTNTIPTTFQLTRSKEIQEENIIVYHFKHQKNTQHRSKSKSKKSVFSKFKIQDKIKQDQQGQQVIQTLFIKFDNEQQYKQWDLGVFINFKIMEDLTKGQVKIDNISSMNSSMIQEEYKNRQSNDKKRKMDQNTNMHFDYLIQKLNNKKIKNIDVEQSDNQSQQHKQKQLIEINIKSPFISKLNSNLQDNQINRKNKRDNANNTIKIKDDIQSPVQQSKTQPLEEETIKKHRSETSHFGNISPALSIEQKIKQAQIQREQVAAEEAKKKKMLQVEQQKKKERMQAMKKTQLELSIKRAKDSLRKGYIMTKYAKSALNPYEKKVFLSEDGKKLCWQDIKSPGDTKSIAIKDITGINQGVIGKGVETHLNPKKISKKASFVVLYLDSKDRKTLDFSSKDELTMQQFCKDLQIYRRNVKD